ncbi:hypothetical protein GCM10027271_41690 [Saccharopolyspora gloriosae]|uniref:DUF6924 domain-containing protein n=1 Tax=Saccharopolyspora gloriosae TaxID=455344 RepID=A0A840NNA6_9PSEU|nr:hypothetical protein [Saccharopolyspora gloriosae]MBB5070759.1 hypothetical protein [Saccharopolyspora gloriosae]
MLIYRTEDDEFDALVVRVDFSDELAWGTVAELLELPYGSEEFESSNQLVDDPSFTGATPDEVLAAAAGEAQPPVVFLADAATMREPYPLLAVSTLAREEAEDDDEYESEMEYGREFRLVPTAVSEMHVNLTIANMDFSEFSGSAADDDQRIHRGFL